MPEATSTGNKVMFSINAYDKDGDVHTVGIFLHFGDTCIKVATTHKEFDQFLEQLLKIRSEINVNYLEPAEYVHE